MTAMPRWLLALVAGAVWGLCFGRQPLLWAPWVVLVPLLLLLRQPRAAWLGWLHGLAFWLVSIPWILPTLRSHGQLPTWMAALGLLSLAAYLALFSSLFAALAAPLWRRGGVVAWLGAPAAWVVAEWLRGHFFSGFPWNLAAYAWVDLPGVLPLASWIGPYGIAFLLLLANTAVAKALERRRWQPSAAVVGGVLVVLATAARWALPLAGEDEAETLEVRILQPDIGILEEFDAARVEEHYQRLLEMSRRACDAPGALVVWPESGAWPYSYSRDERLRRDLAELVARGCPILMNTSMAGDGGIYNSLLLLDATGLRERYDKQHLVPYGEYVPMADWLPFLDKIARNAGRFLRGTRGAVIPWSGQQLAPAICFEITFPEEVASQVRRGGSLLVTVTNDAWYGDSWAPWQHFQAARFRAAENRRYLLRAAITGISAVVRSDGHVEQRLGVGASGVLAAQIPGSRSLTPFTRAPWMSPVVCLAVLAFAILHSRKGASR